MSSIGRVAVVVEKDPLESSSRQWVRVLGTVKYDEITMTWNCSADEEAARRFWKCNLVVCVLDSSGTRAIPLIVCDNERLGRVVHSFVSLSAAHIRDGGYVRLAKSLGKIHCADVGLNHWDDTVRDALLDSKTQLDLVQTGEVLAAMRCHCLRTILRGETVTEAAVRKAVNRSLKTNTASENRNVARKRKRKRVEYLEKDVEQRARLREFYRLKTSRTYSLKDLPTSAAVSSFAARTFVHSLQEYYGGHPGYMQTVARFADGLPPWDRVFVEEWQSLGIRSLPPPLGEKMVLLQYPNANGMGYSFAACSARELQSLISSTDNPTFSEVYREDLALTAIPIDWDMPVTEVMGPKWFPGAWLERIQDAADAASRRLLPVLDSTGPKQKIVQCRMWVSEEMRTAMSSDGAVVVTALDKVTVHANLLLPSNVMLWNYKALRIIYEEMERRFKARTTALETWHLDKSITKLRLPGCFKRLGDGRYVRRLVPWSDSSSSPYDALVHAKHEVPSWEGIDMAILRAPLCHVTPGSSKDGSGIPFDEAVESIRCALSKMQDTANLEVAKSSTPPFVGIQRPKEGKNWCIIKGGSHRNATMYFVIGSREKAWVHCHSDRCKTKREKNENKPYIDLCTSSIC